MTYEEFLESKFCISEAEYNDLVNWSDVPLSLIEVSTKYSLYSTIRFYEYLFDLFLTYIINSCDTKIKISALSIKFNFLFFKLDSQFNIFSDEIKTKILEKYYELLSICKKYHVDKVKEKSPFNYYYEEILKIEPNFTRKNIDKLIQEFSNFDLTRNFVFWGWMQYGYYNVTIYNLFSWFVNVPEYDILTVVCAKEHLNKRECPKNFRSWLLSQNLSEKHIDKYLKQNPDFKKRVLEIYNKFIYWFELDRSFTI